LETEAQISVKNQQVYDIICVNMGKTQVTETPGVLKVALLKE
jgi:hypothetical protein